MKSDRCICGLRVALHRDAANHQLACDEARRRHPRAQVKRRALQSLLALSVKQGA